MKKNDLHDLVRSLTKSEKRHFKIQSQRHGGAEDYLRLFEILEKKVIFDEKSLQNALPNQAAAGQLHVTKNYLREKILESLRTFHSRISRDAEVKDILKNVEILHFKELLEQASDELKRAEKISNDYEIYTAQIEVSRWKRKLEQARNPNRYDRFAAILEEQRRASDALQNNLEHWEHIVRTSQNFMRQTTSAMGDKDLPESPPEARSLESKALFFNTLYIKGLRDGKQHEAEQALSDLLEILEKHPERVREEPASYLTTVNNLASFKVFGGNTEPALELLHRSRRFLEKLGLPDNRRPVLKQLVRALNIELEVYRNAADHAAFEPFFKETGDLVKKSALKIPGEYLLSFHFQFAWVCFLKKDFPAALDWLAPMLNEPRNFSRQFVFRYLLLLNLMVHCEQRNVFVLPYFIENARRQFKKSGEIDAWEQELLHFFAKIGQSPEGDLKMHYRALGLRLFPENAPPLVSEEVLRMLDLRRWLGR